MASANQGLSYSVARRDSHGASRLLPAYSSTPVGGAGRYVSRTSITLESERGISFSLWRVRVPYPASDRTLPVVGNLVPSVLAPITRVTPVQFDVTDNSGFVSIVVLAEPLNGPRAEVVFDGTVFLAPFLASSTRTSITNGYRFVLNRDGGWNAVVIYFKVVAIDTFGNQSTLTTINHAFIDPDLSAPNVHAFSPAQGGSVDTLLNVDFSVDDVGTSQLSSVVVSAAMPNGSIEVIHDNSTFGANYAALSSRSDNGSGWDFSIRRLASGAGWPAPGFTIAIVAVDLNGIASTTLYPVNVINIAPVVGTFSPANAGSLAKAGSASFHVTDDGTLAKILVYVTHISGLVELIHNGTSFLSPYSASSTRSSITGGYAYTVTRTGGWAAQGISLTIFASDTGGLQTTATYALTVTDGPAIGVAPPTIGGFSPPEGTLIDRTDAISFDVLDDSGSLQDVLVWVTYPDGTTEIVHDGTAFASNFLALSLRTPKGSPALVETGIASPFALADLQTLTLLIDGAAQTVTFHTADFVTIAAAAAAAVADAILGALVGALAYASESGTKVSLASVTLGILSTVQVTGGTAAAALGFPSAKVIGSAGWRYRVRHVGGWPATPTLSVRAFDANGNEGS